MPLRFRVTARLGGPFRWRTAACAALTFAALAASGDVQAQDHVREAVKARETLATLDFAGKELRIEGRASEWVGPDPWTRGAPETNYPRTHVRPAITNRQLAIATPVSGGGQRGEGPA